MLRPLSLLAALLLTSTALLSIGHAQAQQTQPAFTRAQIEAIIGEYLEKNGDKIIQSVTSFQQRQQQSAVANIVRSANPTKGPANAPVTIIEFVDFECPFCARVHPTVQEIEKRYGQRIRWVAKQEPLSFHSKARGTSLAALAAHQQGKYWEYADRLWEKAEFLGDGLYLEIAKSLKLDLKKFNADRASKALNAVIDTDLEDAQKVGARGTPYFLINGTPVSGALPVEEFTKVIEAALASKAAPAKR